jgi:hypothetical protein
MKKDSPPEDSSNRKRNSPPGETTTPSRDHVGRHAKLDNAKDQAESPMEVDAPSQVPAVTSAEDKNAVTAMETEMEAATLEESIVPRNAVSPQAGARADSMETMAKGVDPSVPSTGGTI